IAASMYGASLDEAGLRRELTALAAKTPGRFGICVQTEKASICTHAQDRFAMQSVMKLIVAFAAMDAVDTKGWHLVQPVNIDKQDLSPYVQPLAKLVGPGGYETTIGDLVRRAVIDSDSAATDILMARLGGAEAVKVVLQKRRIDGIRVDRDERHLQTEIVG